MSHGKLFYMQNATNDYKVAEVLVVIDKIERIALLKKEEYYFLHLEMNDGAIKSAYPSPESLRAACRELITLMGDNPELADKLEIFEMIESEEQKMRKKLMASMFSS